MVEPVVVVEGVGAVPLPVPPVAAVYHSRLVPVAVSGTAVAFWQYVTGLVTVGAGGVGFTVMVLVAVPVPHALVAVSVSVIVPVSVALAV
jgi:hypothetical protein